MWTSYEIKQVQAMYEKLEEEIVKVRKLLHGCASFFQFGTESQGEQLKKHPVRIQKL